MTKYIFVTGGVVSSLGKGILAASLGCLLRARKFSVTIQKLDPYLNVDPGTMSPYQHGEVFVTEDGAETDLDLGHYERFVGTELSQINNVTAGSIYQSVINRERTGDYLGGTVQMVPHVSNEIKERIRRAATTSNADIVIVEVGGTVGDIEGLIFLEAIRQFRNDVGRENVAYVHVTLLPNLKATSEIKTKPTQHSVEILRGKGIQPDILVCRTEKTIPKAIKEKLSLYTDVAIESVIECRDQKSIYEVPIALEKEELAERIMDKLCLVSSPPDLTSWQEIVNKLKKPEGVGGKKVVKIAIVGKYVRLSDSYISVVEAINHAALSVGVEPEIKWILSDELDHKVDLKDLFSDVDGVIVPGGFGDRGIEGKINAIKHVRENKIPFLGLCLGMQCAVIEFARNVCGLTGANSTEFSSDTLHPVIDLMPAQESITQKGGTMRLGRYPCLIMPGTKAMAVYDQEVIYERHRHRYELNNFYREKLNLGGMVFSGVSPDNTLVELIEIKNHPYFTGSQFHPEFKSRPEKPHPLFVGFVKSMVGLPLLDESKTESKTSQK
ncbi:MAG: CTP synthase [Candidatus Melainabacteria bacterium RIFCSPHIGHO2_02_FULL_34_12]|nr:MAG: CTP synthase [Candidatus Melainabacteria bacterium RIFCSPHIGHO2_02_FULL_34_12]